jgi:hypothetical protein
MFDQRLHSETRTCDGSCANVDGGGRGKTDFMNQYVCCKDMLKDGGMWPEMVDKEAIQAHQPFGPLRQK